MTEISKLKHGNNGNTDSDLDTKNKEKKKKNKSLAPPLLFFVLLRDRCKFGGKIGGGGGRIGPRVTACPRMTDHASAVE